MANKIQGYTVVAYPESMPADWLEKLDKLTFGYVYALHDRDLDAEGNLLKPHIHFFFQGKPTKKQIEYILCSLGVSYGEYVHSANAMYDYLTHENNPLKVHYDRSDIKRSCKWSQELFECNYTPKIDLTSELLIFIENENILEYSDLLFKLCGLGLDDLFKQAKSMWVMKYVDSRRHKKWLKEEER